LTTLDDWYYKVWTLNFQLLWVTRDDFYDSFYDKDYVFAAVNTGSTSAYQIAAKIENAWVPKTLIDWNYVPRTMSWTEASGSLNSKIITLDTNYGIFKKWDIITNRTTNTGEIISLSSDLKTITFIWNLTSSGILYLHNSESPSLIYNFGATEFLSENNSTRVFPY